MKRATKSGRISWGRFERDFPLIKNPIESNTGFDGCLFETYGAEDTFVRSMIDSNRVLTITDSDSGDKSVISTGYHFVNRTGYLITQRPIEYDFWITI